MGAEVDNKLLSRRQFRDSPWLGRITVITFEAPLFPTDERFTMVFQPTRSQWMTALAHLSRRAERLEPVAQAATFVDLANLSTRLVDRSHQVIFGRRGTGKTHALTHLRSELAATGESVVYMDLRVVGSATGHYFSPPDGDRWTPSLNIFVDILQEIHAGMYDLSLSQLEAGEDVTQLVRWMDRFAEAATEVRVAGHTTRSWQSSDERHDTLGAGIKLGAEPSLQVQTGGDWAWSHQRSASVTGLEAPALLLGSLRESLAGVIANLPAQRLWIVIDEWSDLPIDMQPLIADMLRRVVYACPGAIVKVAAVERRTRFWEAGANGSIGLELGADMYTGLDLDEYIKSLLTRGGSPSDFYSEMVSKHVASYLSERGYGYDVGVHSYQVFDVVPHFGDAVFMTGGIPRDLFAVLSIASMEAPDQVTFEHLARALKRYFVQEKEAQSRLVPQNRTLSSSIRDAADGRLRRFLVDRDKVSSERALLDLQDQRLIHLLDRAVGPKGKYDVFAVDPGYYADGLLEAREMRSIDNPWSNWDHVKLAHKFAPVLEIADGRHYWQGD